MANGVFQGGGHLPHCVDGLPGGVFCLAIQILYAALGLSHLAADLCLGIAGGASKSFLYFSSQIFGSSTQAIFVHSDAPAVWLPTTLPLDANAGVRDADQNSYAHGDRALLQTQQHRRRRKPGALLTKHHAQIRETIRNEKVAPLTDVHFSVTVRPTNRADPCDQ